MLKKQKEHSEILTYKNQDPRSEMLRKQKEAYHAFAKELGNTHKDKNPLVQYPVHWQFSNCDKKTSRKEKAPLDSIHFIP